MNEDEVMKRDHERQEVIHNAVQAADRILMENGGSQERLDNLTWEFCLYLMLLRSVRVYRNLFWEQTILEEAAEAVKSHIYQNKYSNKVQTYLLDQVIESFVKKVYNCSGAALMRWDLEHPAT